MKYSKATNYALHTLIYLARQDSNTSIGVQELASQQQISTTYLSKILSQLVKAGMIVSTSGVNGGYSLPHNAKELTFFDVIQAIEGKSSLFECDPIHGPNCLVYQVMLEAEKKMEEELKTKKIFDIAKEIEGS
ncbi:transcriptional regulator [Bacillaceae bacterium SAOS 7]|nr:transcriptional regulator [Bacillaceae bacterium SAOS 7]